MVEQKIKEVVSEIDGLSYMFNDWSRANVDLDLNTAKFPVCVNVLPVSGQLKWKNNNFRDNPNCLIAFLDLTEFDFESKENENIVDRMKVYAMKFIFTVNESDLFEPIPESIPYSVVYDFLDQNLTGIILSIQLKELKGYCGDELKSRSNENS